MNKCTRCGENNPAEIHTCSPQSKAQRLADILQHKIPSIECLEQAAAELRRLGALNAELVGALEALVMAKDEKEQHGNTMVYHALKEVAWPNARIALAKAKEQT